MGVGGERRVTFETFHLGSFSLGIMIAVVIYWWYWFLFKRNEEEKGE